MDTVAAIDLILEMGRKQTTYKIAVLRAVVDLVIERPVQEPRNGFHLIPIIEIARRVLGYYWKPTLQGIPQGHKGLAYSIPRRVQALSSGEVGIDAFDLAGQDAGALLVPWIARAPKLPREVVEALLDTRRDLLKQPLQYLPNVGRRRAEVFGLLTAQPDSGGAGEGQSVLHASYEEHRARALRLPARVLPAAVSWVDLLDWEQGYVVLSARAYEEIADFRFWLRDAILMRWIQHCEAFGRGAVHVPASAFELAVPERDTGAVDQIRQLYERIGWHECLYTGKELSTRWEVDHILPFSRFPVDLFWNLAPTDRKLNAAKSNLLPVLEEPVRDRYGQLMKRCIEAMDPMVAGDLCATWRQHFQQAACGPQPAEEVVGSLWSLLEGSWRRLEMAGVGVWEMGEA